MTIVSIYIKVTANIVSIYIKETPDSDDYLSSFSYYRIIYLSYYIYISS